MSLKYIKTDKAPSAIGPYSQAVRVGNLVFISGQLPINVETGSIPSSVEEQTTQVMKNLSAIVKSINPELSLDNLVKTTIFLKDMASFSVVNEIYGSYFKNNFPARATIEVARLPKDALVEIEAILCVE